MEELKQIVEKLKPYKPEKIILFGSYAWGKPNASSDLDILVIKNSKLARRFRTTEAEKYLKGFSRPVDIIVYTQDELNERKKLGDFFVKLILKKGKILYEQRKF